MIIRVVSTRGMIMTHIAVTTDELNFSGCPARIAKFSLMKWIIMTDSTVPITSAPVSPMKIFDGSQFLKRNARMPPASARQSMENGKSAMKRNQAPKQIQAIKENVAARPSIPSMRFNEFVITITVTSVTA